MNAGDYEEETDNLGNVRQIYYLSGTMTAEDGGNFWAGAASGAFGSITSHGLEAMGVDVSKNCFGVVALSTFSGGMGALMAGGDFWKGAESGFIVGAFNATKHALSSATKQAQLNAISKQLGLMGITGSASEMFLKYAANVIKAGKYAELSARLSKFASKGIGYASIGYAVYNAYSDFSSETVGSLLANIVVAPLGPEANLALGVLETAGVMDPIYRAPKVTLTKLNEWKCSVDRNLTGKIQNSFTNGW